MTVCIATHMYYPGRGGIPNYYHYLAQLLASAGHHPIILTVADSKEPDQMVKEKGITRVTLKTSYSRELDHYKKFFRPGSYNAPHWIAMGHAMKDWLIKNHKDLHIDIVETTDFGGAAVFFCDDDLPPVVIAAHSSATQIGRHSEMKEDDHFTVIRELEKLSFNYCDAVVAHSPMNQAELESIFKRKVDFARAPWIAPQLPGPSATSQNGVNLVVNSLQMIKGAIIMARSVQVITGSSPGWKLNWIGGDSYTAPGTQLMSDWMARNFTGIWKKNFNWLGELDHNSTLEAIAGCRLMIIPSDWDSFNYAAIEAAYFNRPMIMTSTTGASYLFTEDKNVRIVPPSQPETLAQTILAMDIDADHQAGYRDQLLDYFSPAKIIEERTGLYERIRQKPILKKSNEVRDALRFLNRYTSPSRKLYYQARKTAKKIIKGSDQSSGQP